MDTSEEYIKMCDCPEIQKACYLLGQSGHDFFYDSQKGTYRGFSTASSSIWLPHQDQIQEITEIFIAKKKNWRGVWALQQSFHHWFLEKAKIETNTSMEQLWLAFYMHEKHGKTWDGKKWIK